MTPFLLHIPWYRAVPILLMAVLTCPFSGAAQIRFQDYIDSEDPAYALQVDMLPGYEVLDFGFVFSGQIAQIGAESEDVAIVQIEGVRYMDVFVDIISDPVLIRGGSEMPLTVSAAYANRGEDNFGVSYRIEIGSGSSLSARFPIFRRGSGPPGPPPTPPHTGYVPPRQTAYIILYGEVDAGHENVTESGEHTGTIVVTVSYDN